MFKSLLSTLASKRTKYVLIAKYYTFWETYSAGRRAALITVSRYVTLSMHEDLSSADTKNNKLKERLWRIRGLDFENTLMCIIRWTNHFTVFSIVCRHFYKMFAGVISSKNIAIFS